MSEETGDSDIKMNLAVILYNAIVREFHFKAGNQLKNWTSS